MTNEAIRRCDELSLDFPLIFRYQYLITSKLNTKPPKKFPMAHHTIGDWSIFAGSELPVAQIKDRNGCNLALILGIGVDPQGLIEPKQKIACLDAKSPMFFQDFEDWLKHLCGRYTVILHSQDQTRVYGDPVGMNGIVYEPESMRIASSTLLCLDRPVIENPLFDPRTIAEGGKYSIFHTCDAHVHRLNPNAYLDLSDFTEHRFWPRHETFRAPPEAWPEFYDEMVATTKHTTKCIAAKYKTALPISGGQDSRLVASMIGDEIKNISQVFTHIPNYASRIDAAVAAAMAKLLNVKHEIFDKRKIKSVEWISKKSEVEFQTASGVIGPQPQELELGLNLSLADGAVVLRGHQTDLLRAVFIRRTGGNSRINFRWQLRLLNIVPRADFNDDVYTRFVPDYQAWYESLPDNAKEKSIDFAFLEIHYNSTLGVTFPGLYRNFYMSPFNSRRMIELSLSIDNDYRRNSFPVNDILWRENPDLHNVPFDYELAKKSLDVMDDTETLQRLTSDRCAATQERALRMWPVSGSGK